MTQPDMIPTNKIHYFEYGLTVKELKKLIENWPDGDEHSETTCEVWLETSDGLSSIVRCVSPLNKRIDDDGNIRADIIFSV